MLSRKRGARKAREITFGAVSAKSNLFELCQTEGAASGVLSLLEQSRVATEEDDSQVVTKVMVRSNINYKLETATPSP